MELVSRLAKIQQELNAPKGQFNGFGKYAYRSCEDILTAVKPLLGGLILTITDEVVMLGDRFYVKATAKIEGESKGYLEACGWAREAQNKKGMDESQITGSTSSYARKYALNGLFCIDDSKDSDSNEQKVQVDNTPNWYNDFDKHKDLMLKELKSGEKTTQQIIESIERRGFKLSKQVKEKIKGLTQS